MSITEDRTRSHRISESTASASREGAVTVYTPKLISTMQCAFERACSQIPAALTRTEHGRENLARRILAHIDRGERDARRLASLAVRDVRKQIVATAAGIGDALPGKLHWERSSRRPASHL